MPNPLYDAIAAPHTSNEACFLHLEDGTELSYKAFIGRASQIAQCLIASGVQPDDRVLVQAEKLIDTLATYVASVQIGAVYMPLNTAYTASEMDHFINDAAPAVVVCSDDRLKEIQPLVDRIDARVLTLNPDGSGSLPTMANTKVTSFPAQDRKPSDTAALLYTSGTTGRSKGAMLTQRNLLSNANVLVEHWKISASDVLIHALPIFHTHGLFVAINTSMLTGGSIHWFEKFNVDQIVNTLPKATTMMGVPTYYTRLLADDRLTVARSANMRLFISGSAPLLEETHEEFLARTGHKILERYGMTETNMNTSNPYEGERRAGTVGFPLPGVDVIVTDPSTGSMLPIGDVGMIEVRGDNVFKGYRNLPDKTAEELRDNGFFITGDLGKTDADGYLHIIGRQKDLIITGGYNVYPKEVEDVLNSLPDIQESAVFGIPDADYGEMVVAAVVSNLPRLDSGKLQAVVAKQLAKFKCPRRYVVVETLPRNTMGKVQKNILRGQYA